MKTTVWGRSREINQTGFNGIPLSGVQEARNKVKATHVDAFVIVFRYRGASPLASTNYFQKYNGKNKDSSKYWYENAITKLKMTFQYTERSFIFLAIIFSFIMGTSEISSLVYSLEKHSTIKKIPSKYYHDHIVKFDNVAFGG